MEVLYIKEIDKVTVPEEAGITMNQAKAIINHNNKSIYGSINDAFKLGYLAALEYRKKAAQ